ncbi:MULTISPECIES: phage baseplate assembly protein V [Neisseria]|jgi:bacteriophage Mu gp45 protein|uniref:Bacteriophage Mu Gp45 protein n=2 Tax=Neisseria subflava TaxID=28449 RepID=A0A9W5IQ92_NEISU|nr:MULTISPECIES: phage baseplate assembly protein V [Neisseria]DAK41893.1 MAG TPA: baseplate assembly protein V [Caudoviricetes sp.]DAK45496.1 MAG TPA: baseplate assembly protein V [Inoviridae sp.]EFC51625.1 bacteriophage Mu Gp45 protein [Neisseria subflava NJ9703]OFR97117.1 baseplate assembly protein [Neisseria sp. HMSC063B05]DAX41134.1 MAG TPA: baseplate assembly protein V [Caudoviricetes sp.]
MDIKTIDKRIKQAFNTVRQAFRGKVARVQAGGGVQKIQVEGLDGETVQDLEHAENFGFTSNPPAGSDCVVVPLGGKTSHGIIVTTTNGAYRITGLSDGETAVYNADGAKIVLKKGRVIEIDCDKLNIKAPSGVNITSEKVECSAVLTAQGQINGNGGMAVQGGSGTTFTGNVDMVGDLNTTGALTNNGKDVGSTHKHTETNGSETGEVI